VKDVILEAARTVFLRDGYDASIDAIIKEAGIARQSLYNHFKNKEALFRAVVEYSTWQTMKPILTLDLDPTLPLPEALHRFGESYMKGILSPESLALTRLISAAATILPTAGQTAYEVGPSRTVPILAGYLRSQVAAGKIDCAEPDLVAESFFGALVGPARFRYLLSANIQTTPSQRRAYVAAVVGVYVKGLGYSPS
jgi:TetR/AcrR family transcriptional repressor of mexJK operon